MPIEIFDDRGIEKYLGFGILRIGPVYAGRGACIA
jgi:hypothetical protein